MLSVKDIEKLAGLARLAINDDEKEKLREEVDGILNYVGEIQKLSVGVLEKKSGEIYNVFREDKDPHMSGEYTEDLIESAPRREESFIKVKKIM